MGHLLTLQIQDTCEGNRIFSSIGHVVVFQGLMNLKLVYTEWLTAVALRSFLQ